MAATVEIKRYTGNVKEMEEFLGVKVIKSNVSNSLLVDAEELFVLSFGEFVIKFPDGSVDLISEEEANKYIGG